jgi:hypothetical protein
MKRFLTCFFLVSAVLAQPTNAPKRLPPPGIPVWPGNNAVLHRKLEGLRVSIPSGQDRLKLLVPAQRQLPDAEIYEKAVRYALDHDEFYRTNEFAIAEGLIGEGLRRIRAIAIGQTAWEQKSDQTGPVVLGYRSQIDGSAQPYGLVIPASYRSRKHTPHRLDVWLHGRDEKLTELKFIHERSTRPGEFTPPDTFVLHPYGRYCNAFKFAGEIDVLEAMQDVLSRFPIDPTRVTLRGFSMGGAGVWHLATHYADKWVVAAPGAGFAETARYMRLKPDSVPPWERILWQLYDATDYAANLFHCPTVAYSGELDKQKQAADIMAEAMAKEGLPLIHLIGPKTEHKYEPETKKLLSSIVDQFALHEKQEFPETVHLTTRTLRYPKIHWLTLMGLEKHWERADAVGFLMGSSISLWAHEQVRQRDRRRPTCLRTCMVR